MKTLSTIPQSIIYTATKAETVTLNLWNHFTGVTPGCVEAGDVQGLNVKSDSQVFNNNDCMVMGTPSEDADTVHVIALNKGENIYAWCSIDNAVEYDLL